MAPLLSLLLNAYGIGEGTPLKAPQASLVKLVVTGVFDWKLPWLMIGVGMGLAVVVIVLDLVLERRGSRFRMPVLAVAVGIYLPVELGFAILTGGLVSLAVARARRKNSPAETTPTAAGGPGVLFAAGLITGEALLGILLAIPIVISGKEDVIAIALPGGPVGWLGAIFTAAALAGLFVVSTRKQADRT